MRVIFGEYKPDQPANLQDGLIVADGCYRIANGYVPLGSFEALPHGTLASTCLGAGAYRPQGETYIFLGTATDIYRYQSSGLTSLASGLNTTTTTGLRFCAYQSWMLATNGVDPIKKFDPVTPTTFTTLDADAPTARFLATVGGFVVCGYAAGDPLRVQWCDQGDPSTWTPATREANFFIQPTGGDITGLVGGEYGILFQENRIVRFDYTADDTIWRWTELAVDIGCIAPQSLASYGKLTFFLSNKGPAVCDGNSVQMLGDQKFAEWFMRRFDRSYLETISAAVDPVRSLYYLTIPNANPANAVLIYNYALQQATTAPIQVERLFSSLALGLSLEDLDNIYGNLDAIPGSLDSAAFSGGYPILMVVDGTHSVGALTGSPVEATFQDAIKEPIQGRRARVKSIRPMTDAATMTVTVSTANSLDGPFTESAYNNRASGGIYRTRVCGNYVQVKLSIPAGTAWSYIQGYDSEEEAGGRA